MNETTIMRHIQLEASKLKGVRLLRNNVGKFQDLRGVWTQFGVGGPGGSDLIGWKTITITQEMVGKTVAVFLAVEVKSRNGKLTTEQAQFLMVVRAAGGIGLVPYSIEDAMEGLSGNRF